jgi:hypothetical protein
MMMFCIPPKYATNPRDTTIHCCKVSSELWFTEKKSHIIIIPSKITHHHHPVQNHTPSSSHPKSHFIIPSKITLHHLIQRKGMGVLHQQYNIHQRTIHRMPIIAQLWMNLN